MIVVVMKIIKRKTFLTPQRIKFNLDMQYHTYFEDIS